MRSLPYTLTLLLATFLTATYASAQQPTIVHASPVRNPDLLQIQNDWRQGQMLESLGYPVTSRFNLGGPLTLVSAECGMANAFYVADKRSIVLCLEIVPHLADQLIRDHGREWPRERLIQTLSGSLAFVYFHEVGHALIHMLQLPVLGREEDAADQVSTYILLNEPSVPPAAIYGALRFFRDRQAFFAKRHMTGEHSLNPQRIANIACWAYGSDSAKYAWAIKYAGLPASRAQRCESEYQLLKRSVEGLLAPHQR